VTTVVPDRRDKDVHAYSLLALAQKNTAFALCGGNRRVLEELDVTARLILQVLRVPDTPITSDL
jgi:hypothetical protein